MQVYFIRHAQSVNNALGEMTDFYQSLRRADPQLTELGIQQAKLTTKFLSQSNPDVQLRWVDPQNACGFGLTHIYCSLMERAVQTGAIIAENLELPLIGLTDLHEVGGIFLKEEVETGEIVHTLHGHNRHYLQTHYPRLLLPVEVNDQGWWKGGFEPPEERFDRAQRILNFFIDRHGNTDDKLGVIIHGGIYRYLFRFLFNSERQNPGDLNLPYDIIINNCSISRYDFFADRFMLLYHNRLDFLPAELIT